MSAENQGFPSRRRWQSYKPFYRASPNARLGQPWLDPSQQGQCTLLAFGNRCKEAGVRPLMGSVGGAYDNAMCESFVATLECELLDRFTSQAEARIA